MISTLKRSFLPAAWLGWQIESNWTDPILFFGYSVLKPLAGVLILVFMYTAVSGTGTNSPMYAYIYVGNAFYIYVGALLAGASYAVLDDRERYRVLKYLYIAPIHMPTYLFGRAVARFVTGSIAVVITLVTGVLFFNVPIHIAQVDWLLFFTALAVGVVCLCLMGIFIGTWTLTIRNESWQIGEAVAAALYLFSGAIFPISTLPPFLQPIGYLLPLTYWLELIRRALLGPSAAVFPPFAAWSNANLFGVLILITIVIAVLTFGAYQRFDRIAREKGLLDVQSNF